MLRIGRQGGGEGGREGGREGVVTQDCFQLDSHRVSCGHMR